ncbi:Transcriptional regulator lysR family protein [Minicystis rosea]|nr:Transcriptional regulator lysR family protein [Minicystis rosea]
MATTAMDPGWELYRSMLAVVNEGSLSGAARALGLTQPTVGRHVDALEAHLGKALFTRSQTGLLPTDAALTLVPHAEAMARAAEALVRTASGEADEERGSVRLTASELIGIEILAPLLPSFMAAHPRIAVELLLSSRAEDLARRDADVAVRLFRPTQSALIARRLGALGFGLHAHPSYLASRGKAPRTYDDLAKHAIVGFDSEAMIRRVQKHGPPIARDAFAFRCDSYVAQQAALRAGAGIGTCMFALARRDGLVRVLPSTESVEVEVWLVMHEAMRTTRRVRLLFDFLADRLGAFVKHEGPEKRTRRRDASKREPNERSAKAEKRRPATR